MKKEDFSKLLDMSQGDLINKLKEARREVVRFRMKIRIGQEKNTSAYQSAKKLVAQIQTAIVQKELAV